MQRPVADLHHRFGAFIADWHIRTIPLALWGFWIFVQWFPGYWKLALDGTRVLDAAWQTLQPVLQQDGVALFGWICFGLYLAYHPLVELAMHGESPGKRMFGITVISIDGARPTARQVLVRNAWRALEFLPFAYAWGALAILRSPDHRRHGDVASGTRVVMR